MARATAGGTCLFGIYSTFCPCRTFSSDVKLHAAGDLRIAGKSPKHPRSADGIANAQPHHIYAEIFIREPSRNRRARPHPAPFDFPFRSRRCHSVMSRDQAADDTRNTNTRTMMTTRTRVIPRTINRLTGKTPLIRALCIVKYL